MELDNCCWTQGYKPLKRLPEWLMVTPLDRPPKPSGNDGRRRVRDCLVWKEANGAVEGFTVTSDEGLTGEGNKSLQACTILRGSRRLFYRIIVL